MRRHAKLTPLSLPSDEDAASRGNGSRKLQLLNSSRKRAADGGSPKEEDGEEEDLVGELQLLSELQLLNEEGRLDELQLLSGELQLLSELQLLNEEDLGELQLLSELHGSLGPGGGANDPASPVRQMQVYICIRPPNAGQRHSYRRCDTCTTRACACAC